MSETNLKLVTSSIISLGGLGKTKRYFYSLGKLCWGFYKVECKQYDDFQTKLQWLNVA